MPLEPYIRPRLVVLKPTATVLEAGRAIEQNRVGAVVVQDKRSLVGILTDRDLAVRVVGRGLDPNTTTVDRVMTTDVIALAPADMHADALRIMQRRNIRRIPLVEDERVVGMVTLDDLLLDEAAPIDRLSLIVQAQIGDGGPVASDRSPSARRSTARAQATYARLLGMVRSRAGLASPEEAEQALDVVLAGIARRITADEADHLITQLPSLLQPFLYALPPGPDKRVTRETIEAELMQQLGVDAERAAQVAAAVGSTVAQSISAGQARDVQGQLPEAMRALFARESAGA